MTHGKTYNKSPRRINHKATKSKTNTGTTVWIKALLQLANFTLGPDATLNTEIHKKIGSHKGSQLSQCIKTKTLINHHDKQRRALMANSTVYQSK